MKCPKCGIMKKGQKSREIYEVENSEGKIAHLGVENFRDGFALWLITPGTPFSIRV